MSIRIPIGKDGWLRLSDFAHMMGEIGDGIAEANRELHDRIDAVEAENKALRAEIETERRLRLAMHRKG